MASRVISPLHYRFGRKVAQLRKNQDLTQEELAEKMGLHSTYIAFIENGNRNPSLRIVFQLARALRIRPEELLK